MWDERELRRLAGLNHGLVAAETAARHGANNDITCNQVALGRWVRIHPGVFYLNVTPQTWKSDLLAAVMAAGPDSLASHRSAARLWLLDGIRSRALELTVPYSNRPKPEGTIRHRTRRPLPATEVDGIPTTSVERTLLDLAPLVPAAVLEKLYMSALHQKHTSPDLVATYVNEYGGRGVRGTRKLRRIIPLANEGITASGGEVELRQLIRDSDLPPPIHQLRIALPDGFNAYPDFSWPDQRKIVELDGYESHSTPEQLHLDLIRQNALMDLGWEIRRFTGRRIRREPRAVLNEITRFVRR